MKHAYASRINRRTNGERPGTVNAAIAFPSRNPSPRLPKPSRSVDSVLVRWGLPDASHDQLHFTGDWSGIFPLSFFQRVMKFAPVGGEGDPHGLEASLLPRILPARSLRTLGKENS